MGILRALLLSGLVLVSACGDGPSEPRQGSLVVNISGLPSGATNAVRVTGPDGSTSISREVSSTDTLTDLDPGVYVITAQEVSLQTGTYTSSNATQQVEVEVAASPASVTVIYGIITGSIALNINGLPTGLPGATQVSGTGGYSRLVTSSQTLTNLQPGTYQISSSSVTEISGHIYSPTPISQSITVLASETPKNVTATYALVTGAIDVVVSGLPAGLSANVTVSGPGGFSRTLSGSQTIVGVFPGSYIVATEGVISAKSYGPTLPSQTVDLQASTAPLRVEVVYVELNQPVPPNFNLTIAGLYVTQVTQTLQRSVPLIAGKPALVRVFARGTVHNAVLTTVRLQIFNGQTLQQTLTLLPNVPGVPVAVFEGTLSASWNTILPPNLVQPGLRLVADVDNGEAVSETSETDNRYPAVGAVEPLVVEPPPLNLTIVPVRQSATGLTGAVNTTNVDSYLEFIRKVMPIRDYRVTVHPVFTSSSPELVSNDGNNGWFHTLGDVEALRVAEGSSDYYLGFVRTNYNSGMAGIAFTPGKSSVAWDLMPNASRIAAHELGHSFGRRHAPCGVSPWDPSFPYLTGNIGVYGYDMSLNRLVPPTTSELMGYCGFGWISDYTYTGILNYRATGGAFASRAAAPVQATRQKEPSLVLWGSIVDGQPVLEPAFKATTLPVLPARPGPYRIEARAADGGTIFSFTFEGEEPSDLSGRNRRHFAFAVPLSDADAERVARLTLTTAAGGRTELIATPSGAAALEATIESSNAVRIRVTDRSTRLAVVRDRTTNRIIALIRGRQPVTIRSTATELEVQLTDGVRSRLQTVRPVRR